MDQIKFKKNCNLNFANFGKKQNADSEALLESFHLASHIMDKISSRF